MTEEEKEKMIVLKRRSKILEELNVLLASPDVYQIIKNNAANKSVLNLFEYINRVKSYGQ